jgi:hypothetical protein
MTWESCVNTMLLDERVLYPGPVLGGLARIVLSRKMPGVAVHGLISRGANSVVIAVTRNAISFELGVQLKIDRKGFAFFTTMRRRIRTGQGFGVIEDDRRIFLQDDPEDRIVLRASSSSYRSFWETGLKGEWNKDTIVSARYKINQELAAGNFAETFLAILPNKDSISVLPLQDLSKS